MSKIYNLTKNVDARKILVVNPMGNPHFGYELVRALNIRFHASTIKVIEPLGSKISYGCEKEHYESKAQQLEMIE